MKNCSWSKTHLPWRTMKTALQGGPLSGTMSTTRLWSAAAKRAKRGYTSNPHRPPVTRLFRAAPARHAIEVVDRISALQASPFHRSRAAFKRLICMGLKSDAAYLRPAARLCNTTPSISRNWKIQNCRNRPHLMRTVCGAPHRGVSILIRGGKAEMLIASQNVCFCTQSGT